MVNRMIGMARRPRIHFPGAIYHAMARGVDGRDIYVDNLDRVQFLEGMRRIENETSARVLAYCLMGNHFHLAIKVERVPLSFIMQRMLSGYCRIFNRRHDREGHLFQARHKAIICLNERYLANLIPYIHLNPVRSGFVAAPQDWPWSSYESGQAAIVDADFDPWPTTPEVELARLGMTSLDLETIGACSAAHAGVELASLRSGSRERRVVEARRIFVREAVRIGSTLTAAARWLKTSKSSVSRYARDNTATTANLTPTNSSN